MKVRVKEFYGWLIFGSSLLLSLLGLIFVYTGSYFWCVRCGAPPYAFALKQSIALVIGVLTALLIYRFIDYRKFATKRFLWGIYLTAIFLLVAVLLFGKEINNSKSWIIVGGVSFQPAELAKILIIIFDSAYISYKWYDIKRNFKFFLAFIAFGLFIPDLLILAEGDLGSAMILTISVFAILFITGLDLKYILYPAAGGLALFTVAVITAPYRLMRIKMLLNPEAYMQTGGKYSSYQLVQAFVAFAKGGLTGMGIGNGVMSKFQFLTFAFSDFMFAHIAEEVGALGTIFVLLIYLLILYAGLSIADRTDEQVGKYMALGLTLYIFLQAVVHMGVNIGLVPTTGITLPFMSMGGSSLISSFLAVGVLMSIARHLPPESKVSIRLLGKGRYAD